MVEFKCVINDVKTGKSYQKIISNDSLLGKKIRDKIDGGIFDLNNYELEITGGSDNSGFPMRREFHTSGRKKALLNKGPGVKIKRKGMFKRKTIMGNTINPQISQINLKVTKYGSKKLGELFGGKEEKSEEVKEETKPEIKEKADEKKEIKKEKAKEKK